MHMADALISPAVGGAMIAVSAGSAAYSVKKIRDEMDERKIPLMGIMGAFVFALQMINFSIPGTGSSGHIAGGLLLAVLLGPYAGFLTMVSVLIIQAFFFADGGLLALGCNIFNIGFLACFIGYPLVYRSIAGNRYTGRRLSLACVAAGVIGLQLGSFGVVMETMFSGKTGLPFVNFLFLMQPIHFAIGIVEGAVTAALVVYIWRNRPEMLEKSSAMKSIGLFSIKKQIIVLAAMAVFMGGFFSWFASTDPDGLEWSVEKTSAKEAEGDNYLNDGFHGFFVRLQNKTAFMPDYDFKKSLNDDSSVKDGNSPAWPSVRMGTSVSGILGGVMVLLFSLFVGYFIRVVKKRKKAKISI